MSEEGKREEFEEMYINKGEIVGPLGEKIVEATMDCAPEGWRKATASFGTIFNPKTRKTFRIGFIITQDSPNEDLKNSKVIYDNKEIFEVDEIIKKANRTDDCPCSNCKSRRSLESLKDLMTNENKSAEELTDLIMKTFNPKNPHGKA